MTDQRYSTKSSALILVDVLNDFLADDGKLAGQIGPMIKKLGLRANLQRLLDGARKAGIGDGATCVGSRISRDVSH